MKPDTSLSTAREIMVEFARLTGLSPASEFPRRYLWTDAFAVCNFLELYRRTNDEKYRDLALRLVEQVHILLGRHREDDPRAGWISGLNEEEGQKHPTKGGLRIGKKMNERQPRDPFDEGLEWDRDGQYYHYLTKWMHALSRVSRVTGDSTYLTWARELAKTAHAKFAYAVSREGPKRIYWKMSIDLSYPLVPSMGQHDPLDGFITYRELQEAARKDSGDSNGLDLKKEISELAVICEGQSWVTDDPLGIGGLLSDVYKLAQMALAGNVERPGLLENLLDSSLPGLETFARRGSLELSPDYRLAFRELGLSIGLRAVERLGRWTDRNPGSFNRRLHSGMKRLRKFTALGERIEEFWLEEENRRSASWREHRDINTVMLATSLAPDGYLAL